MHPPLTMCEAHVTLLITINDLQAISEKDRGNSAFSRQVPYPLPAIPPDHAVTRHNRMY